MRLIDTDLECAKRMREIARCEDRIGVWQGRQAEEFGYEASAVIREYRTQVKRLREEMTLLKRCTELELDYERLSELMEKEQKDG